MENLMARNFISKNLRHSPLTILLLTVSCFSLNAQVLKPISSIKLKSNVNQVSIDRQGYIYVAASNGDVDRLDGDGTITKHFSPTKRATPSLIEAWQGLRVFVFYQDFQEYLFLDRFLAPSERYSLTNQRLSSTVSLSSIAADDNIWVFDSQNLSLKKIDIQNGEMLFETNLNFILKNKRHNFTYIREYQNLLFLSDKNEGILVFDNIGNYLETLPLLDVDFFSFNDTRLLTLKANKLITFEIYDKEKKEVSLTDPSYNFVLMENKRVFLFAKNRLDIFEMN